MSECDLVRSALKEVRPGVVEFDFLRFFRENTLKRPGGGGREQTAGNGRCFLNRGTSISARGLRLFVPALLIYLPLTALAQEIRYLYDDLNRLIAVIDQQGRTAIYEYDAVGNILTIRRVDATGPVAITLVNPT
ncbi:MAG: RHS repeat domain-containing protein, partial [Nitrospiria bacterium]